MFLGVGWSDSSGIAEGEQEKDLRGGGGGVLKGEVFEGGDLWRSGLVRLVSATPIFWIALDVHSTKL